MKKACDQCGTNKWGLIRWRSYHPKSPERKIPPSIYEDARDTARALGDTAAFEQSRHDRKRVEMLLSRGVGWTRIDHPLLGWS
jgi:hypothetical protein